LLLVCSLKPHRLFRFLAGDHYGKGKSIVEALMDLRRRVDEMLLEHRAEIEERLKRMDRAIAVVGGARVVGGGGSALKGRKVPPKYRGPSGETWAGRGARPLWLVAAIKGGKKLENFLIDKSARKGRKKRRSKR
jgi:DNA-binding protein H-NS